ncbi:hypothetical protein ATANTOWER_014315 [Ataeniobius toweri]|uniref:Uncharacterized protein n=1 Tax=Ataeniobius toweri TaxID=208326 RepID=A0ABU7B6M0_9TELE|nr:hypothetical protein [Ataeniobius toweri]
MDFKKRFLSLPLVVSPPAKSRGESQGNHAAATVQKPQGAAVTSLLVAVYARADPAMDPETRDPITHHSPSRGPPEPWEPWPWQAANGSEPANTKAPSSGHREPQVHQRVETPTTDRECGVEELGLTFDGGTKLIQEREQPKI